MPSTTPSPPAAQAPLSREKYRRELVLQLGVPVTIAAVVSAVTYVLVGALAPPVPLTGRAGYEVAQIHYELDSANALRLQAVTFVVDPAGTSVPTAAAVRLNHGDSWYPCQFTANRARCSTPGTDVPEIAELSFAFP